MAGELPLGPLHPLYTPAKGDERILIEFMGNTARIVGYGFTKDIDPFQMIAASIWLRRQADQMLAAQERAAMAQAGMNQILKPGDPGWVPPPGT